MQVDVIFFIEHVARELDIACAIKALLENEHGVSVVIKSIAHELEETVSFYHPQVVVLPYCNGVINHPPEKMIPHWPNARYISLTFEQVLGKAQLDYIRKKDEFTRKFLFYSVWGEFYRQILLDTGVDPQNIRINGSPTLNLYRPPYRFFYPQDKVTLASQYGLSPDKRWIFVPENYGWAFFHDRLVRDRIQRGFNPQHAYQYREFSLRSLEETAAWWCALGQRMDAELIVRPRPATPENDFRAKFSEFGLSIPPHLHIIKDGTVREWIIASDIVMSSFSTTLIEAAVAHKPVYMLTPFPLPDFLYSEWYDDVEKIHTLEAFVRVCSGVSLNNNWFKLENWVNQTLFSGADAIQNIVETIMDLLDHTIQLDPPTEIARLIGRPGMTKLYRRSRKLTWKLYQGLLNLFGFKTLEQKRKPHEKDFLSPDLINPAVDQWWTLLSRPGQNPRLSRDSHPTTER